MCASSSTAIRAAIGLLAVGILAANPAQAYPISLNPSAVGLNGSAFSADALKATEVSHIQFTGPNTWTEHGYAYITDALSGGSLVAGTGLWSDYTLYLDFSGTGDQATGTFSTATMTLYGVNGKSVFGIDDSTSAATVYNNGNTPLLLATSNLIAGTTGIDNTGAFFADLLTTFTPQVSQLAFFAAPANFISPDGPLQVSGHFYHPPEGVTQDGASVVLVGGDDTLTFIPEPASLALLALGLGVIGRSRRRG